MERKPCPSDLTDAQRELIEARIPPQKWGGRTREVDMREVLNGLLYLNRAGFQCRHVPKDLPDKSTVRHLGADPRSAPRRAPPRRREGADPVRRRP